MESAAMTKLSPQIVEIIRKSSATAKALAATFNVSESTISRIRNHKIHSTPQMQQLATALRHKGARLGTQVVHERKHTSLSAKHINDIELDPRPYRQIAHDYGVSRSTIARLKSRYHAHLDKELK